MTNDKYEMTPFFMDSEQGQLFTMYYSASLNTKSECIIYIPAFFEEMNKSRHMVTMQSSAFAEQGFSVLVFDLWGTGDSQGEVSDATWPIWLQNIQTVIRWVQAQGINTISFWGLRSGVLLALDFLQQSNFKINQLICWQPVLNGETFIMQFLRLRVAAAMMDKNAPKEKTSDLKRQLQSGHSIEVAGYPLNPDLINPLLKIRVQQLPLQAIKKIHVFELTTGESLDASYAIDLWVKDIEKKGLNISLDIISDCFFWATQEISWSDDLIKLSSRRLG